MGSFFLKVLSKNFINMNYWITCLINC
jgi:hypothetical protein